MKAKRKTKIFALLMTVVLLFSNSFVYSEAGKCTHGGENFNVANHTYFKKVRIGCSEAAPHIIYVMGELALCRVYHYKVEKTYYCNNCHAVLWQEYSYEGEEHEYEHE